MEGAVANRNPTPGRIKQSIHFRANRTPEFRDLAESTLEENWS